MDKYINKGDAIFAVSALPLTLDAETTQRAIEAVRQIPAADVVEVVRCKDCKLWSSCLSKQEKQVLIDTYTDGVCEYWMSDGLMPNDFCSYGKRKEGE